MKKKKTVGLITITNTKKAALQTRGDFNIEKNKPETYIGASQLTAHGSILKDESEIDALLRETKEELGEDFANLIKHKLNKERSFVKLNKAENNEISIVNFAVAISEDDLKKININKKTGAKIRLITKDEIANIRELKLSDKKKIINENEIVMFYDDIEAVKLAFEKLTK